MAHVSEAKEKTVEQITGKIEEYPIICVLNMEGLPAKNLAAMRKRLRSDVEIIMAKKRLVRIAFDQSKKDGVSSLADYFKGMPALLFTRENPFRLFRKLKRNQSSAPIKAGQESPRDITIPAGPTSFAPGPIIGELGQLGIKAGIEGGKVVIKQDATVVREGDIVNEQQAGFLARMGIEPMKIGLSLLAAYEEGNILTASVLDIDEDAFDQNLRAAIAAGTNLAFNITYPTGDNIATLLQKAHYDAAGLALEAGLLTDKNARELLAKAYWQAVGVAKYLPEEIRGELPSVQAAPAVQQQEEPKEDKKEEEEKIGEEEAAAGLGSLFG